MPIDYSKWNNITLSDDEGDGFEICNGSGSFRLPAQHPLNNKALSKEERQKEIQLLRTALENKVKLERKLASDSLSEESRRKYVERLEEVNAQYEGLLKKGESVEVTKKSSCCTVVKDCSRINSNPSVLPGMAPLAKEKVKIQQSFFDANKELLIKFCRMDEVEDAIRFLKENPQLLNIQTADILVSMAVQYCNSGLVNEMKVALVQAMRMYVAVKAAAEMPVPSNSSLLISSVCRFIAIADKHWRDELGSETSCLERMCEVVRKRSSLGKSVNVADGDTKCENNAELLLEAKSICSGEKLRVQAANGHAEK
uniref:Cdc37 N-terminal domain-containing protein n=1 Tax=Trichuris muris TaxID=70415 RepID=A0A5S6QQ60_TRIMR